jgi:CheY-like chemotaxis protein
VEDTGIGIPEEQQRIIFERYRQAGASTTGNHGGTGLGLAIARDLACLMGGALTVESRVNAGTAFRFEVALPVAQPSEDGDRPIKGLERLRVLVVDDYGAAREAACELLCDFDIQPALVANGEDALKELREAAARGEPFHVVLIDADMRGLGGKTLASAIRNDPDLPDVSPILLEPLARSRSEPAEEDDLATRLTKPLVASKLSAALAAVLRRMEDDAESARISGGREAVATGRRPLVLLAEDNLISQRVAIGLLKKLGLETRLAVNGMEAVALFKEERFDLVIMDCLMPDMDGYQATREIRALESGDRQTPIVALTATAMKGDAEKCLKAGMTDYVAKPVTFEELRKTLGKYVPLEKAEGKPGRSKNA